MHALIVCLKYASDDNSTLELKCLGFCCVTHSFSLHLSKDITVLTGVVTSSQITFCLYHRSYRHLLRICKTYCFFFPQQHWLRERALLLRYACIDCLFDIRFRWQFYPGTEMSRVLLHYSFFFTAPVKRYNSSYWGRYVLTNHVLPLP